MTISREEFVKIVKSLMTVVTKDSNILGSHAIAFSGKYAQAFNDYLGVSIKCPTPFQGAVHGTNLYKVVSSFTDKEIEITETAKGIKFKCGKASTTLTKLDVPVISRINNILPTENDPDRFPIPANFVELMHNGTVVNHHPKVTGVYVSGSDILATDNSLIYHGRFDGQLEPFRLSYKAVEMVNHFEPTEIQITSSWVFFFEEDKIIMARQLYSVDYPAQGILKAINAFKEGTVLVSGAYPSKLPDVLKVGQGFASEQYPACRFVFAPDSLTLSTATVEGEWVDVVESTWEGEGDFEVPPGQLLSALKGNPDTIKLVRGYGDKPAFVIEREDVMYIMGVLS